MFSGLYLFSGSKWTHKIYRVIETKSKFMLVQVSKLQFQGLLLQQGHGRCIKNFLVLQLKFVFEFRFRFYIPNFWFKFIPFINTVRKNVFLKLFVRDGIAFNFPADIDLKGQFLKIKCLCRIVDNLVHLLSYEKIQFVMPTPFF